MTEIDEVVKIIDSYMEKAHEMEHLPAKTLLKEEKYFFTCGARLLLPEEKQIKMFSDNLNFKVADKLKEMLE